MKKYLIVKFKNAGFFAGYKTGDYVCIGKQRIKRETMLRFKEPITKFQVTNLLHVLFGERPVPSFRKVFYGLNDHYVSMAEDSYVKIESYIKPATGKMPERYPWEAFTTRKAVSDSWNPIAIMYWEKLRRLLELKKEENPNMLYEEFVKIAKKLFKFNSTDDITFDQVCEKIRILKKDEPSLFNEFIVPIFKKFSQNMKTPAERYIIGESDKESVNKNKQTLALVNKSVDQITRISGTILVPVTDADIEVLRSAPAWATLLDGGFVKIESISDENSISSEGFTKVSEISIEKVPINKLKVTAEI